MDAIKDVYKSREPKRMTGEYRCTDKKVGADEDLDAPNLGKIHYRCHSDKYGMDIEFLYNAGYNFIETAYLLRMNKKPEGYVGDRLDKK